MNDLDRTPFRDRFGIDVRELYGIDVEPTPVLRKKSIREWFFPPVRAKDKRSIPIKPILKPIKHKLRKVREISIIVSGESLESQDIRELD